MPTFITYASFSTEGCKGLIAKPEDRAVALKPMFDAVGATIKTIYFTTGSNDAVVISEAPDGTDAITLSMVVGASGAMSSLETVRAWTSAEFVEIAQRAGSVASTYSPPGS